MGSRGGQAAADSKYRPQMSADGGRGGVVGKRLLSESTFNVTWQKTLLDASALSHSVNDAHGCSRLKQEHHVSF